MTFKGVFWTFVTATIIITVALIYMLCEPPAHAAGRICGTASWYGSESGNRTASGERFNPDGLTIAMRSRDFGRQYLATFGGRAVVVRHTDYGPARSTGRQFDLSRGTAVRLGIIRRGIARICLTPLARAPPKG